MKLTIDGKVLELEQGKSIHDAILQLDMESDTLKNRPLAAMIGGAIYSLRFRPTKDSVIRLLRYNEEMGRRVYERTLQFLFIMSVRRLFPQARVNVRYTLGPGLYISIDKSPGLTEQDVLALESECRRLVRLNIPLERKRLSIGEALPRLRAT